MNPNDFILSALLGMPGLRKFVEDIEENQDICAGICRLGLLCENDGPFYMLNAIYADR